jgi:pimeloyl-ACP methyl ester carboxylesterase
MQTLAISQNFDIHHEGIAHCAHPTDACVEFFLYTPASAGPDSPTLICVHGISRNALEHVELFRPYADRSGAVLIAPVFSEAVFGKYQQLISRDPDIPRSDVALLKILEHTSKSAPINTNRVHLFGYSGGGQFAHRFSMLHPDRVETVTVGAAGWYTFPDPSLKYPLGIAESPNLPGLFFSPDRFLKVPTTVLIGPRDASRKGALRKSDRLDSLQGQTRIERGQRWIAAMENAAKEVGIEDARHEFRFLSGGRHSFAKAMNRYGLGEATCQFAGILPSSQQPERGLNAHEPRP